MSRYVLSPDAAGDLVQVWRYIQERGSKDAADLVLRAMRKTLSALAASPGIGHRRPELASGDVRFFTTYSYLIVYRESPGPLQIIAILHGAREVRSILEQRTL